MSISLNFRQVEINIDTVLTDHTYTPQVISRYISKFNISYLILLQSKVEFFILADKSYYTELLPNMTNWHPLFGLSIILPPSLSYQSSTSLTIFSTKSKQIKWPSLYWRPLDLGISRLISTTLSKILVFITKS